MSDKNLNLPVTSDLTPEERALMLNDLSALKPEQRASLYVRVCESVGLNHLTQPFQYLQLNGKLVLYAARNCTDQLRKINGVSLQIIARERVNELYAVTARATTPDGRSDESIGAVVIGNLKGDALANALMKAETKAKRRVTLSICGLSFLDESELDTVKDARPVSPESPGAVGERLGLQGAHLPAQPLAEAPKPPPAAIDPEKVKANQDQAKSYLESLKERHKAPPEESNDELADFSPGDYVVKFKSQSMQGLPLREIPLADIEKTLEWINEQARKPLARSLIEFKEYAEAWIAEQTVDDGPPLGPDYMAGLPDDALPDFAPPSRQ